MAHPFVAPLDPLWKDRLEALAAARGWPTKQGPLAEGVRRLSESYNTQGRAPTRWDPALQAARLLFFLPRDVAKGAGAMRELAPRMASDMPLRVLDLGAGTGATSLGATRALRAAGHTGPIELTLVDTEPSGLELAAQVLASEATVQTHAHDAAKPLRGSWDLILLGQVLCELDLNAPDRAARHARWLDQLMTSHAPEALVVVEPALRPGTRHLHAVRDQLIGLGRRVFAPCPHDAPCPMLTREADWCHAWLDVGLPAWLQPVAREAGLRWEGLTFAELVLRRDGAKLGPGDRVVSDPVVTKGRRDLWLCREDGSREKLGRLDRHATAANAAWDEAVRGDRLSITGAREALAVTRFDGS